MSRLQACFDDLREQCRTALVPFVTAGDPAPTRTVAIMHALVEGGADITELGIPSSNPAADGPVIQRAHQRALQNGTDPADVLAMVAQFRSTNDRVPVVLMTYLNSLASMGHEEFAAQAGLAGVDGVLPVDLPPDKAAGLKSLLASRGLDLIFPVTPATSEQQMDMICRAAAGFIYCVSLAGVSGSGRIDVDSVTERLAIIREKTRLPVGVGFGIRDARTAAAVSRISDAVIVGTVLVENLASFSDRPGEMTGAATTMVRAMREAMDSVQARQDRSIDGRDSGVHLHHTENSVESK